MMKISKALGIMTPLMIIALVSGPVHAHEGGAVHGVIALLLPVSLLILALVLMKRHLARQRRR